MIAPVRVLCIYRVKDGKEGEFRPLLEKHWPTLNSIGLVTSEPARWYLSKDKKGRKCFVELFEWKDAKAPQTAHELPAVMAVWEPMGRLVEDSGPLVQEKRGRTRNYRIDQDKLDVVRERVEWFDGDKRGGKNKQRAQV